MNIKSLLIAHGEKALVALVIVLCAWWVYVKSTDTSIRFDIVSLADFDNAIESIRDGMRNAGEPIFRDAPPIPRHISERLASRPAVPALSQWLVSHPDLDKAQDARSEVPERVVLYNILVPRLQARPRVGSFELTISLPDIERESLSHEAADDQLRMKSGPRAQWERHVGFPVRNHARWHSVLIEYAIGEEQQELEWQPLVTPDTRGGQLPLDREGEIAGRSMTVVYSGIEEWALYHFRARLLVDATGFAPGQGPFVDLESPREVLVLAQPLDQQPVANEHFDDLAGFQEAGNLSEAAKQRNEDGLFMGLPTMVERHRAPSTVAICLQFARAPMAAGDPVRARFLIKRKVVDRRTRADAWTVAQRFDVEEGDAVGMSDVEIRSPFREGERIVVDLRTPFVVESIDPDVERIFYYEVRHRSTVTEDGAFGEARFQVVPISRRVGRVVLRNAQADLTVPYLSAQQIRDPTERRGVFYSPSDPGRDEIEDFEERTDDFLQPVLAPPTPKLHDDEERSLLRRVSPVPVIPHDRIQLPYVEMPDGRVLYYDTLNNRVIEAYLPHYGQDGQTGMENGD